MKTRELCEFLRSVDQEAELCTTTGEPLAVAYLPQRNELVFYLPEVTPGWIEPVVFLKSSGGRPGDGSGA